MKLLSLLLQPAKTVLKHTQSKRFATIVRLASYAKRLDCGGSPPLFHRAAMAAVILFVAPGATAQTTNVLSDAEVRGRQLAQQLLEQRPTENFTNTGVLKITGRNGSHTNLLITFKTLVFSDSWENVCDAETWTAEIEIVHKDNQPSVYFNHAESNLRLTPLGNSNINSPFAGSDFWLCDLGLEFLHWPDQKILRGETMRGVFCKVLESSNPNPPTNAYSRVVSWIDNESFGIVQAKAYDAKGNLLKEFWPKDIRKMNGQWQVGSLDIRNVQTRSRTKLEFDLKAK